MEKFIELAIQLDPNTRAIIIVPVRPATKGWRNSLKNKNIAQYIASYSKGHNTFNYAPEEFRYILSKRKAYRRGSIERIDCFEMKSRKEDEPQNELINEELVHAFDGDIVQAFKKALQPFPDKIEAADKQFNEELAQLKSESESKSTAINNLNEEL